MAGNRGGRPSKLTPQAKAKIVAAVKDGTPFKYAALAAGIDPRTLRRWMAAGRKGKSRAVVSLLSAVKKAESESVVKSVKAIRAAGAKNWTAHSWLLERRFPQDFALNRGELKQLAKLLQEQSAELASLKARLGEPLPDAPAGAAERGQNPPAE